MKLFLAALVVLLLSPLVSTAQQIETEASSTERAFTAVTLNDARAGFMSVFGLIPKDCDPVEEGWVCSEFDVSAATPVSQPLDYSASVLAASTEACTAYGATLDNAQNEFSTECPWRVRQTCEPLVSSGWACSTTSIADSIYSQGASAITLEEIVSAPPPPTESTVQDGVCTAYGSNLGEAQSGFSAECPWRIRQTCDPLSSGQWACSTTAIADSINALSTPAVTPAETPTETPTETPAVVAAPDDVASSTPLPGTVTGTGVMNTTYQPGDLLIIAHDSGPDTDDMQAIVANRMIMDLYPTVNFILVGATQGHAWTDPTVGSESHAQSLFPEWINAKASTSGTTSFDGTSVIEVADNVEKALGNGGTVHIAEGGPSDFTAEVIRLLQSRGVHASSLKRIRVVQHSAGASAWNEQQTSSSNLALVKSASQWVPIANGNVGGNATADFQEPASSSMCQRFMRAVSGSQYSSQWAWAYSTIGDTRKCDQSDSVELLYILNDTSTKTFDQFSSRYL
jgi:hypothetical protein